MRYSMALLDRVLAEVDRLRVAGRRLDCQVVTVLVAAAALVILQDAVGSRRLFRTVFAEVLSSERIGLLSWGWWFTIQGITGFVIPLVILLGFFRRTARDAGLGLGDWRFAGVILAIWLPVVFIATWFLSASTAFQTHYPHHRAAMQDWGVFALYEAWFILYWIGWEYLWRGFVLFGTVSRLGMYAIFIQAIPFALLHLGKPLPETVLSLVGGIALGALVWRCRAFWVAVPMHAAQMTSLDLWCTLRTRSGTAGTGVQALIEALGGAGLP